MRIEPNHIGRATQRPVGEVSRTDVNGARPTQGVTQGDQVVLSQRASEVQLARQALASAPQVRAQRVAELKKQLQSGTFRVDADTVADKIVSGQ